MVFKVYSATVVMNSTKHDDTLVSTAAYGERLRLNVHTTLVLLRRTALHLSYTELLCP